MAADWRRGKLVVIPSAPLNLHHNRIRQAHLGYRSTNLPFYRALNGLLGESGFDGARRRGPDLMGYCGGYEWISDYHYDKVLDHMIGTPDAQPSSSGRVIYDPERMIAPSYQQGKEQA